jgi:hypothetical protein
MKFFKKIGAKVILEHIAVRHENKKRFEYLKKYLISREKPKVTQDEILSAMMDVFEDIMKEAQKEQHG